jgi:hypothetical protein
MPAIRSALVVTAVCSIATGTYFAFSDDVLTIGRQTEMQIPYEDHIAELRAQVDRIDQFLDQKQVEQELTALFPAQVDRMSGQFFDQKRVEQQLTTLLQRQATLEQLTSALTGDLSTTGSIKPERIAPPEATPAEKPAPASQTNDTATSVAPPEHEARLQSPKLRASATTKYHRIHRPSATTKYNRIHRAARHHASLRHRVGAPLSAAASIAPPRATPTEKPDTGLANQ